MKTQEFIEYISKTYEHCLGLIKKKNADYANDDNPFANFELSKLINIPVDKAILVRMSDKLARISTLLDKEPSVVEESIEDTLNDLINYAAILKAYLKDKRK